MNSSIRKFAIKILLGLVFLIGCTKSQEPLLPLALKQQQIFDELEAELAPQEILVIDTANNPIADAQITIDDQKNVVQTNAGGKFFVPASWQKESTVVISKKGIVTTTFLDQPPVKNIFQVKLAQPDVLNEVTGVTTGYPNLSNDGWADVAIVLPTMSQSDLMAFEMGQFISPELDEMSIMGFKVHAPSNVSIPKQTEKYNWLINVDLDKPIFRTYFNTLGRKQLAAIHGRFEFKPAVSKFQSGSSFLDLINDFKFASVSVNDVELTTPKTQKNLDLGTIKFDTSAALTAPAYNSQQVFLGAGLIQKEDTYIPSDLKFFKPKETHNLLFPNNSLNRFALAYWGEKQKVGSVETLSPRMSLVFSEFSKANSVAQLDLISAPQINNGLVNVTAPTVSPQITQLCMSVVLYKVKKILTAKAYVEQKRVLAEVYVPTWVNQVPIPESFIDNILAESDTRIEVSFFGTSTQKVNVPVGLPQISTATHTTRNATDF